MEIISRYFNDILLIKNNIYEDTRGSFEVTHKKEALKKLINEETSFIQDNISISKKNVIRGLHFQKGKYSQGKLLSVLEGKIQDICIDLRNSSSTFGMYCSINIDSMDKYQLWIPKGFAHGFLALEHNTRVLYKVDNNYNKESEDGILWNDPNLKIEWQLLEDPIMSEKDSNLPVFNSQKKYF